MTKTEMIQAVAAKAGFTQKDTKACLDALQEVVFSTMKKQEEVKVFDGVTLTGVFKEARTARNPLTNETVNVPEKLAPKAKFGKAIKDYLNA